MSAADLDRLTRLDASRLEAMLAGQVASLEKILDDDLEYTHTTGDHDTKASFLATVGAGDIEYLDLVTQDVRWRILGDTALASGHLVGHSVLRGQRLVVDSRYLAVWVKRPQGWRFTAWHALACPGCTWRANASRTEQGA